MARRVVIILIVQAVAVSLTSMAAWLAVPLLAFGLFAGGVVVGSGTTRPHRKRIAWAVGVLNGLWVGGGWLIVASIDSDLSRNSLGLRFGIALTVAAVWTVAAMGLTLVGLDARGADWVRLDSEGSERRRQ